MDLNNMNELDRIIDEALRSEPMRPVPTGFHRRIEERVQIAAVAHRERKGFHARLWASSLLFVMLGITIVIIPAMAFFQGWTVRALPGAMGYFDYLTVFVAHSWVAILAAVAIGAGVVALAVVVWMLVPRLRDRAARQH